MAMMSVLTDIKYWVAASIFVAFAVGSLGDQVPNMVIAVLMLQMIAAMAGLSFRKDDFKKDAKPIFWSFVCCCTALAEYSSPFTIWIQPTRKASSRSTAKISMTTMIRFFLLLPDIDMISLLRLSLLIPDIPF